MCCIIINYVSHLWQTLLYFLRFLRSIYQFSAKKDWKKGSKGKVMIFLFHTHNAQWNILSNCSSIHSGHIIWKLFQVFEEFQPFSTVHMAVMTEKLEKCMSARSASQQSGSVSHLGSMHFYTVEFTTSGSFEEIEISLSRRLTAKKQKISLISTRRAFLKAITYMCFLWFSIIFLSTSGSWWGTNL